MKELSEQDKNKIKEMEHTLDCFIKELQSATAIMNQLSGDNFDPALLERLIGKKYGE